MRFPGGRGSESGGSTARDASLPCCVTTPHMGRDWALEQAKIVSESLSVHTRRNQTFNETRKAIGDAIEAAVKAKG